MTTLELAAVLTLGFIGFCSVCLALLLVACQLAQREIDESRFRRELREGELRESNDQHISEFRVRREVRSHAILVADHHLPPRLGHQ